MIRGDIKSENEENSAYEIRLSIANPLKLSAYPLQNDRYHLRKLFSHLKKKKERKSKRRLLLRKIDRSDGIVFCVMHFLRSHTNINNQRAN